MTKCKCKSCKRLMKIEKRRRKEFDELLPKPLCLCEIPDRLIYGMGLWKSLKMIPTHPYFKFETEVKGELKK